MDLGKSVLVARRLWLEGWKSPASQSGTLSETLFERFEKLLSGGMVPNGAARLEQLRILADGQGIKPPYAFPILIGLFALAFVSKTSPFYLMVPVIANFFTCWLNRRLIAQFRMAKPEAESSLDWARRFTWVCFVYSCGVASMGYFFWIPGDTQSQTVVLAALVISLATGVLVTGSYMPALALTILPILVIIVTAMASYADLFHSIIILVVVMLVGLLSQLAHRGLKAVLSASSLREDKNQLIEQLFRAKRDSDVARSRAEEANRAKSNFLANMSHELRTPLNAIIGFSEVMGSEIFGPHANPSYKEYSEDIHRSGQHLLGLINDILDLSRIEAGRYQITEELVDIVGAAEDSRRILDIRAQGQRITITTEFAENLPMVFGDARALRQTWINLLTNAVKFSPPGSTVKMLAHMDKNGSLRFGVHDEGPGIADHEIEKVMEAFTQGATGMSQPGKGSGLGLSIVRGLISVHDGKFELKSVLGKGTQAEAVIPADRLRWPDEPAALRDAV